MAFAIDHRAQLEAVADRLGVERGRIGALKLLAVEVASRVANGRDGFGMLLDSTYGERAMVRAAKRNLWIGRPVEKPGSRPLDFDHLPDLGSHLVEWPVGHTVKCLCFYHPDDDAELKARQERELMRLYDAARTVGRELLVEIIAGRNGPLRDDTVAAVLARLYDLGIRPDWWKLEPQKSAAAWRAIEAVIAARDPYCRGIVMLGLEAPEAELRDAFRAAAATPMVKGFAVGRTIFAAAAEKWLGGAITDEEAVADMAAKFESLVAAWQDARRTEAA
jgi:5-dehydro-2-deoxygluconokinase